MPASAKKSVKWVKSGSAWGASLGIILHVRVVRQMDGGWIWSVHDTEDDLKLDTANTLSAAKKAAITAASDLLVTAAFDLASLSNG